MTYIPSTFSLVPYNTHAHTHTHMHTRTQTHTLSHTHKLVYNNGKSHIFFWLLPPEHLSSVDTVHTQIFLSLSLSLSLSLTHTHTHTHTHIHTCPFFSSGHLSSVDTVSFHPNCNYVATGSCDRTCRLWDITMGECVRLFKGHRAPGTNIIYIYTMYMYIHM